MRKNDMINICSYYCGFNSAFQIRSKSIACRKGQTYRFEMSGNDLKIRSTIKTRHFNFRMNMSKRSKSTTYSRHYQNAI